MFFKVDSSILTLCNSILLWFSLFLAICPSLSVPGSFALPFCAFDLSLSFVSSLYIIMSFQLSLFLP